MSRLIDDLLNFSRISNSERNFTETDLNETMVSVLSDFDIDEQNGSPKIIYDELPVVEAVPLHMKQLFHNLISNGIKFAKKDEKPVIEVTTKKPDKNVVVLVQPSM